MAIEEPSSAEGLAQFPGYVPGRVPQYVEYHDEVDFLDELEAIWGERWGAQGIGRLRKVAMTPPLEVEVLPVYNEEPAWGPTSFSSVCRPKSPSRTSRNVVSVVSKRKPSVVGSA